MGRGTVAGHGDPPFCLCHFNRNLRRSKVKGQAAVPAELDPAPGQGYLWTRHRLGTWVASATSTSTA